MKASISEDRFWFVVRTGIKAEDKASLSLHQAGFDVYFPRRRVEKWNKRTNTFRTKEYALMQRYLFIGSDDRHPDRANDCDGVEEILGYRENYCECIPHRIVAAIHSAEINMKFDDTRAARKHRQEEVNAEKSATEAKFPVGSQVKVIGGPFSSFSGIIEEVTTRGSVKALLSLFGRMSLTEFDPEHLQATG